MQNIWNKMVEAMNTALGSAAMEVFIAIIIAIVAVIVLAIAIPVIVKKKKKAKQEEVVNENDATVAQQPIQVVVNVNGTTGQAEAQPVNEAPAVQEEQIVEEPQPVVEEVVQEEPVVQETFVVAEAPIEQSPVEEAPVEETHFNDKANVRTTMAVVPEGEEARKNQILLAALKRGRTYKASNNGTVAKAEEPVVEETPVEEPVVEETVEETPVVVQDEQVAEEKKPAKKKTTAKKKTKKEEKPVEEDEEKKAMRERISKLEAEKEESYKAEIERLRKEKEEEKARTEELATLKAEKKIAEEKAKADAEAKKAKEQAEAEAKKAKAEAAAEAKKAKEEAEAAKKEAAKAKEAEKKAAEEAKKAKEEMAVSGEKRPSGKWVIEVKGESEYIAKLYANNGEVMLSSELYTTEKGARNGIATLIKNIAQTGTFEIYQDKNKNYYYKLKNANKRLLCVGEIYKTKDQCVKAVESVKRLVTDCVIMTELEQGDKYIEYVPETIDVNEIKVRGKWKIEMTDQGRYTAKLYASNGQLMLATEGVASVETATKNIESVKKNAESGNFVIDKDKFGRFYYKLRNVQKSVICIGEAYESVENCKNAIESVRRFALVSDIEELPKEEVAVAVEEKKPATEKKASTEKKTTAKNSAKKKASTTKKSTSTTKKASGTTKKTTSKK